MRQENAKFQTLFDSFRTKVEQLVNHTGNLAVGHIHVATSVSVHEDVDRACYTDSIVGPMTVAMLMTNLVDCAEHELNARNARLTNC